VYNSISKTLLKEQVTTNLNNALKNATGVTRLWESTGRGGDGAEYYTMRGFSVQPTIVNGMPNISNGTIDPINIETLEVIKGPSGTLFGSSLISYGGLINIVTKKPFEKFGGELGFVTGSYGLNRFTADINTPLSEKVFARINASYHYENSFQDAGFNKALYLAPSLKVVASEKLTFLLNTEFKNSQSTNAPMIFLSRYSPLSFHNLDIFEKYYKTSFTTNSLSIENPTFGMQAQALYKISESWTSQTVVSTSNTKANGYYHYLWDNANGDAFTRFISRRNGATYSTDIQQNFIGDFKIGELRNRMVVGVDYLHNTLDNNSTGWVANGVVSLADGSDTGVFTPVAVDDLLLNSSEGKSRAETKIVSGYISNVLNILPTLSAMASVRVDNFNGKPMYATSEVKSQTTVSPKFGVVYQPIQGELSVFANYMNGFSNLAPAQVSDMDGSNPTIKIFEPERANQWEAGVKGDLLENKLSFTASYYNILVSNKTMTDPNNPNNTIQGGEVSSKGFEVSIIAQPFKGLSLITGFSHNEAKVVKDATDGGYLEMRPEEAGPANLFNFWANYRAPEGTMLKGLGLGFGANYASEHKTLNRSNIGTFTLPSYTVFNAVLSYDAEEFSVNLKADNLANTKYYSGWSTITPQRTRTVSLGVNYKF